MKRTERPKEKILVVDDEPGVRDALLGILEDEGFDVATVESGEAGLEALRKGSFDAVLLDVWLPGIDGLETLVEARESGVDAEVVMISGHGTIETAVRATKLGAFDFVEKPLSLEKTLLVLRNALRQRRLERRTQRLMAQLSRDTEIVGGSAAAEQLRQRVTAAAGSPAPVLLCGARGTGRETIARRIHAAGAGSDGPFVVFPCGALEGEAAVAALFGSRERGGRLALAAGGTLFVAEVQLLEPSLQTRLASVAAETPGTRLVAGTAPDPSALTPGLREALDVIRIDVPSLGQRREDIPLLAERFLGDLAREYGRTEKRLSPATLVAMQSYDWPGNVAELRNLMERLLLLSPDDTVGVADLPEELGGARGPAEDLYREFRSLAEGLETFERYWIRRVLTEERGELTPAAARLGIDRSVLEVRIDALGLRR